MARVGWTPSFVSEAARQDYLVAHAHTMASSPLALDTTEVPTPFGATWVGSAGPVGGPPLVALHGKHCSSTMWLDLLPTLATRHRAHLVDRPGELGCSVASRPMARAGHVAAWLDAVLDGLDVDGAVFVGFSNGGCLAATYATRRPDRVRALALLAPGGVFGGLSPSWCGRALLAVLRGDEATWARFWARHYRGGHPSPLRRRFDDQVLRGVLRFRFPLWDVVPRAFPRRRLAALTMPVLAMFAGGDIVSDGPRAAARARRVLPQAAVVELAEAGHFVVFDRLPEVAAGLGAFLARGGPGPPGPVRAA